MYGERPAGARAHVCDTCGGFSTTDGGRTGQIRVCEKKIHRPCRTRSLRKFPNDRVPETTGFDEGSAVDGLVRFKVFFFKKKQNFKGFEKTKYKKYKYNKTLYIQQKI